MISSFSGSDMHSCVDVEVLVDGCRKVTNSNDADQMDQVQIVFTKDEWDKFIKGVKAGEFD